MKICAILLVFVSCFTGCRRFDREPCKSETKKWKLEAAEHLLELKAAVEEIQTYDTFLRKEYRIDSDDFRDSDRIEIRYGIKLPALKKWLREKTNDEWRYIKIDKDLITASYKSCYYISGFYSSGIYYGYLYHSPSGMTGIRKDRTKIIEQMPLGDDWYYILSDCEGCGD